MASLIARSALLAIDRHLEGQIVREPELSVVGAKQLAPESGQLAPDPNASERSSEVRCWESLPSEDLHPGAMCDRWDMLHS